MGVLTLTHLQGAVGEFVAERFPDHNAPLNRAAKLCEETGEVMGAVIKIDEGRKTRDDLLAEIGDVLISLCALAESIDADLMSIGIRRFEEVSAR